MYEKDFLFTRQCYLHNVIDQQAFGRKGDDILIVHFSSQLNLSKHLQLCAPQTSLTGLSCHLPSRLSPPGFPLPAEQFEGLMPVFRMVACFLSLKDVT